MTVECRAPRHRQFVTSACACFLSTHAAGSSKARRDCCTTRAEHNSTRAHPGISRVGGAARCAEELASCRQQQVEAGEHSSGVVLCCIGAARGAQRAKPTAELAHSRAGVCVERHINCAVQPSVARACERSSSHASGHTSSEQREQPKRVLAATASSVASGRAPAAMQERLAAAPQGRRVLQPVNCTMQHRRSLHLRVAGGTQKGTRRQALIAAATESGPRPWRPKRPALEGFHAATHRQRRLLGLHPLRLCDAAEAQAFSTESAGCSAARACILVRRSGTHAPRARAQAVHLPGGAVAKRRQRSLQHACVCLRALDLAAQRLRAATQVHRKDGYTATHKQARLKHGARTARSDANSG